MTDRPALAEALGHAVDRWLETMPGTAVPEIVFERVLAEHETAREKRIADLCNAHEEAFLRAEAAEARCAHLEQERDEARRFGEEAARRYNELLEHSKIVTCAFCGEEYPRGTPRHGDGRLAEHIKVCQKHPMRELEAEHERLRAALVALIAGWRERERLMQGQLGHKSHVLSDCADELAALVPSQEPK